MYELAGQVHWHEPSGFRRAGFGKFERPKTRYDLFMESDDIPIFRGTGVSKVQNLPLAPWPRLGGRGSYIQLHGIEGKWGAYVVEVPGAGALHAEKHLYEEFYFIVEGRGSTEVWLDGEAKRYAFEWQQGSLFAIPVNAMHRIINAGLELKEFDYIDIGAMLDTSGAVPVVIKSLMFPAGAADEPARQAVSFPAAAK